MSQDDRIATLRRYVELNPDDETARARLATMLNQVGETEEAKKIEPTQIKDARNAREFVLASNGKRPRRNRFTIVNQETNQRITFSSQRERLDVEGWDGMNSAERAEAVTVADKDDRYWIVSAMVGSDNNNSYTPFGIVRVEGGLPRFYYSTESEVVQSDTVVQAFAWLFQKLNAGVMPSNIEFHHEGRCGRCGLVLTVPESIESGIGPVCHRKYHSDSRPVQPQV